MNDDVQPFHRLQPTEKFKSITNNENDFIAKIQKGEIDARSNSSLLPILVKKGVIERVNAELLLTNEYKKFEKGEL